MGLNVPNVAGRLQRREKVYPIKGLSIGHIIDGPGESYLRSGKRRNL